MHFHSNAALNHRQRQSVANSEASCRVLAAQLQTSATTVARWKARTETWDRSSRPHTIHTSLSSTEEDLALWLRESGLSLDLLFETLQPILPHVRRCSLHRLLVRQGKNRLPRPAPAPVGEFAPCAPGFVHVDCFYLPKLTAAETAAETATETATETAAGRYCFVAIDRTTRLLYLRVYPDKTKESGHDFLERVLAFFPFTIETILTDNGREFTLAGFKNRWGTHLKPSTVHPFEALCQTRNITHRRTRPYTPKTNGMVERANGLTKQNTIHIHHYDTPHQMEQDLDRWFCFYNWHRPHRKLGYKTPWQTTLDWYNSHPQLFTRNPHLDHIPTLTW